MLKEAQILTERGRIHYNRIRPHSSLRDQPPAPETIQLASWSLTWRGGTKLPAGHATMSRDRSLVKMVVIITHDGDMGACSAMKRQIRALFRVDTPEI